MNVKVKPRLGAQFTGNVAAILLFKIQIQEVWWSVVSYPEKLGDRPSGYMGCTHLQWDPGRPGNVHRFFPADETLTAPLRPLENAQAQERP